MKRRDLTLLDLAANLGWPWLVLTFGSDAAAFGPRWGPAVAMVAPLGFALWKRFALGRTSPLSILVIASISLNAAVGFLPMDAAWFAWKEALLPMAFALVFALSALRGPGLLAGLLDEMLDGPKVTAALLDHGATAAYLRRVRRGTVRFGLVTALSGLASGVFAAFMITSPTGSTEFAVELGRYTAWSYGVVTIPTLAGSMWVLRDVLLALEEGTGKPLEEWMPA
ncbi:MAG: VC0807 family protein [Pseudomonadota bacterium]|nr:VC0807 family protein [Pseudomonadota bacterium]